MFGRRRLGWTCGDGPPAETSCTLTTRHDDGVEGCQGCADGVRDLARQPARSSPRPISRIELVDQTRESWNPLLGGLASPSGRPPPPEGEHSPDDEQHAKDGFVVKFEDQQIINQVFYDERGAFRYGVKYCEEKDLGKEIRYRVHKEFPGYQIDVVSEINSDDNTIYLMSLKNKTSVKNIMLSDSDLKVIEDIMYAAR